MPTAPEDNALTQVLGPYDVHHITGVDVYLAGEHDLLATDATITVRQATNIPGWVGIINRDLTEYQDFKLELTARHQTTKCRALFTISDSSLGKTLIRGPGHIPGTLTRTVKARPRVTRQNS